MLTQSTYFDKLNKWSSHSWFVHRLSKLPPGTKILDIGASTGILARLCQGKGLEFDGIEPNPEWAEIARPYYKTMVVGLIDECMEQIIAGHHVVICADVLEHLPNPGLTLSRLSSLLSPGGLMLVSVPNIANIWIRLNLLLGRFDYSEYGILDRTHLRFFTRKTVAKILSCAGLRIDEIHATPIPLERVSDFYERSPAGRTIYILLKLLTDLFPTLFGFQFVIESSKE